MKTKKDKQKIIQDLAEKFKTHQGYLVISLLNLNSASQFKLRELLKDKNSLLQVVRKTLVYKAKPDFPFKDEELQIPFAFIWNFDPNFRFFSVLKKLKEEGIEIKILKGYLWNQLFSQKEIEDIINLPSKEELVIKIISLLKEKIYKMNFILGSPLRRLISFLSQIKNKN